MNKIIFNTLASAALLLSASLLTTACNDKDEIANEVVPEVIPEGTTTSIPYSVTVMRPGSEATRVTVDTDNEGTEVSLKFQEGDKLFVYGLVRDFDTTDPFAFSEPIQYMEGELSMQEQDEPLSNTATFAGKLNKHDYRDPDPDFVLLEEWIKNCVFIVRSVNDKKIASITHGINQSLTVTKNPNYIVPTLADAVEKYSYFCTRTRSLYPSAPIQFSQETAFFKVHIDYDDPSIIGKRISSIAATFKHTENGASTTIVNMEAEANIQVGKNNENGHAEIDFVIPFDVEETTEKVYDIALAIEVNGVAEAINVNFAKKNSYNTMAKGQVYSLKKNVKTNRGILSIDSEVGTIGIIGGREAIVVSLPDGSGRPWKKVAIATMNLGATSVSDSDPHYYTINQARLQMNTTYWRLPNKEEIEALNRLSHSAVSDSYGVIGTKWTFTVDGNDNELYLPFSGSTHEGGATLTEKYTAGHYWCNQYDGSYYWTVKYEYVNDAIKQSYTTLVNESNELSVRPFHDLN